MERVMILLVALMLALATAAPIAAQGDDEVPFKGAVHGYGMVEPDTACPPVDLRSVFTTTGHVTSMGNIQLDYYDCTPEGADIVGTEMSFVAENGDCVFATYEAHQVRAVGEEPMLLEIADDFGIVGGTGQFEGVSGGGQLMGFIGWPGFEPNYWPSMIVIDGTIAY